MKFNVADTSTSLVVSIEAYSRSEADNARRALKSLFGDSQNTQRMSREMCAQLLRHCRNKEKVQAIKLIREVFGINLKESKEFLEENFMVRFP